MNVLQDSILDDEKDEFSFDLFNLVKREIAKTGEPNKLMSSADLVGCPFSISLYFVYGTSINNPVNFVFVWVPVTGIRW